MVHPDINKLQNFNEEGIRNFRTANRHRSANKVAGSHCMHIAVGDHSRYASASIIVGETVANITKHLISMPPPAAYTVKRVLTDNGSGYKSNMFAEACQTMNV